MGRSGGTRRRVVATGRARQHKTKRQTRSRLSVHETTVPWREAIWACYWLFVVDDDNRDRRHLAPVTARVIAPAGVKRVSRRGERRTGKRKRRAGTMMISGTSIARVATCILLGCCVTMRVAGSAIPMWEFLSRDEKVSTKSLPRSVLPIITGNCSLMREVYQFSIQFYFQMKLPSLKQRFWSI